MAVLPPAARTHKTQRRNQLTLQNKVIDLLPRPQNKKKNWNGRILKLSFHFLRTASTNFSYKSPLFPLPLPPSLHPYFCLSKKKGGGKTDHAEKEWEIKSIYGGKSEAIWAEQWREGDGSFTGIRVLELPFSSGTAAARLALQFAVTNERRAWWYFISPHFTHTNTIIDIQYTMATTNTHCALYQIILPKHVSVPKIVPVSLFASNVLWGKDLIT